MSRYPRIEHDCGNDSAVLQCDRPSDKVVAVMPELPGAVIVVHGVNDVGVGYEAVEQGLCSGLNQRLQPIRPLCAADYRMPQAEDARRLEPDPDAVFFKRAAAADTHSPVIPFYWGYRPAKGRFKSGKDMDHGQAVDEWGNRLDKDLSKGGGPFANATSTLPDMWNRGFGGGPGHVVDRLSADPLRPVLTAPGRMYMVLAAQRLAALVAMIRDYAADDVVSLLAHSLGCMLSLLAQAFLLDQGLRPADTLVLTHLPYSLVDDAHWTSDIADLFRGGEDQRMRAQYPALEGRQTLHARLQTLVNIVQRVARHRHATPVFEQIDASNSRGMVGAGWQPSNDRDNRGKVVLYFCPEDMTVALDSVQGISWQGVPDYKWGVRLDGEGAPALPGDPPSGPRMPLHRREPLKELGNGFFQRVFTARRRVAADAASDAEPQPVLVGTAAHDFPLRVTGENDHGHVAKGAATLRATLPEVEWPPQSSSGLGLFQSRAERRKGVRRINGEPLPQPVAADMYAGAVTQPGSPQGAHECVDPIDAAISVTSRHGLQPLPGAVIDDPRPAHQRVRSDPRRSPLSARECQEVERALNQDCPPGKRRRVVQGSHAGEGQLRVVLSETADEARLRQQQSVASRSFHSAIFGRAANHRQVTAYDVAIGQGKAVSDPGFRAYLCAVADWRLKEPEDPSDKLRTGILAWERFVALYGNYYGAEPDDRKNLIYGNCVYYSTGELPQRLPVIPENLPSTIVCETVRGRRLDPTTTALAEDEFTGPWLADQGGSDSGAGGMA